MALRMRRLAALAGVLGVLLLIPAGSHAAPVPKIVGGAPTTIDQYPWQAALALNDALFAGSGFQRQFCGGTLVAPTIVITAAHCTFKLIGTTGFDDASNFEVFTGRTNLSSTEGQAIDVSEIYYFEGTPGAPTLQSQSADPNTGSGQLYNPVTNQWDAVFLKLSQPSTTGTPIKIAGPDETATWAPEMPALISGWGSLVEGPPQSFPEQLHAAQLAMVDDTSCANAYAGTGITVFTDTMVCAGIFPQGGIDTCQGDSGGPLVVPVFQKSKPGRATNAVRLVGDTSFGIGCAEPNFMGIYGRVASDPMRSALRNGIQSVAGVDVVGSGAQVPDNDPPQTTLTGKPKKKIETDKKKVKAIFRFTSDEVDSSFECKRDSKKFRSCASPYHAFFKKGPHTFQVRAIDDQNNTDGTAAKFKFKVKRT